MLEGAYRDLLVSTASALALLLLCVGPARAEGPLENLGVMAPEAGEARVIEGPGASGEVDTIYMLFNNALGNWLMVALNTRTGESAQYNSTGGEALVTSCCFGADGRLYAGTVGGQLYRFDPAHPELGLTNLGHVREGEGYLFALCSGPDGRLYMGSYPGGKLLGYAPRSGEFLDFGRAADDEMYTQFVAPLSADYAYAEAGVVRHRVVRMNLRTGEREEVRLPEGYEDYKGFCNIYLAADGRVNSYLTDAGVYAVIEGARMVIPTEPVTTRKYGEFALPEVTTAYDFAARQVNWTRPDGSHGSWPFTYQGAASLLFLVARGPGDWLYGSSYLPLRFFRVNLATREHENLGNPFPVAGGEIYAMLTVSPTKTYAIAYGNDDLLVYDPTQPWQTVNGKAATEGANPRSLGVLGSEQNRCYDMLAGPDGMVYLGTTATYGKIGGAVTRLDPATDQWETFRNCIPDHNVGALSRIAGEDRLIAGGSVALGSGRPDGSLGEAQLFLWDTRENRVAYRTAPPVPDMWYILQLETTPEGLLIGTCGREYARLHLFVFDPRTREFVYTKDITDLTGGYIAEATGFSEAYQGRMFFTVPGKVLAVDTTSFAVSTIAEQPEIVRGGVLAPDPAHGGRMTYFTLTKTELLALPVE